MMAPLAEAGGQNGKTATEIIMVKRRAVPYCCDTARLFHYN